MQLKKLVRVLCCALIFSGSTLVAFSYQPGYSASFTVNDNRDLADTNPGDGVCKTQHGTCTLRAAMQETNQHNGPNTITIPEMTILIENEFRVSDHAGDDSVHIVGAGIGKTIIDGGNKTRVFFFAARSGSHSISGLTIRNAKNQYPTSEIQQRNGGGVFNEAVLKMTDVRVTNSRAYQGGGVFNQHDFGSSNVPTLTLENVTLDHNMATSSEMGYGGGGLFNGSVLDGTHVTITDNTAGQQGGGFYNNSFKKVTLTEFDISRNSSMQAAGINNDIGTIVLKNGTIQSNSTRCCIPGYQGTGGAGIFNNNGTMDIVNVDISYNVSDSPGGFGAGIFNFKNMSLTNVSITNNRAAYGAGIDNGWASPGYENNLILTNVTISGNVGPARDDLDSEGAAIHNRAYGTIHIYNSTITKNTAEYTGGITNRNTRDSIFLQNTIVAENEDDFGSEDCNGTFHSMGYNMFGNPTGSGTYQCTVQSQPSDILYKSPRFATLMGLPSYHPLLDSSPAIEKGTTQNCPSTDIRGYSRPAGYTCDIGAYEADPNPPVYLSIIIK